MQQFWGILFESLPDNWYIIVAAIVAVIALAISLVIGRSVDRNFDEAGGKKVKSDMYAWDEVAYTIFITIISIFPLLGMFGTVMSLINLGPLFQTMQISTEAGTEMQNVDMSSIKSDFFLALTSTAWGIIFSVVFKLINAFLQTKIENQIAKARKILNARVRKNEQK